MKEVINIVKKWGGHVMTNINHDDPPSYVFKNQSDAVNASREISSLGLTTVKLDKVVSLMR